jgi:hypothetical protein
MTDLTRFVLLLSGLIIADFALTLLAVGYMGATELNPLYAYLGGLPAFFVVKGVVSVVGVIGLFWLGKQVPRAAKISAVILCVLYGIAVFGGAAGLVWITLF